MASKYLLEISASNHVLTQADFRFQLIDNVEHRFKVHGEGRAVVIVGGPAPVDKITTDVEANGPPGTVHTKCIPLISYQSFATDSLGVTEDEVEKKGTAAFNPEKETYWAQFDVGYEGHTLEELRQAWHDEAVAALGLMHGGQVPMVLYKTVFKKQVHLFIQMDGAALDQMTFQLPLFKCLGDQVKTTIRRVGAF